MNGSFQPDPNFNAVPTIRFYCVICGAALKAASESQYDLMKCHSCSRHVPVPKPANLIGNFTSCQAAFPARVLALSVTFQCTECESRLCTDARWEGRQIDCPDCGGMTEVPRWSTVPNWPRSGARENVRAPAMPPPIRTEAAALSVEEIDFLRGGASSNPEAAA